MSNEHNGTLVNINLSRNEKTLKALIDQDVKFLEKVFGRTLDNSVRDALNNLGYDNEFFFKIAGCFLCVMKWKTIKNFSSTYQNSITVKGILSSHDMTNVIEKVEGEEYDNVLLLIPEHYAYDDNTNWYAGANYINDD